MSNKLPIVGKARIDQFETVIQTREQGRMPTVLMELDEYWLPPVGHIFFVMGHGVEVVDTATFLHVADGPDHGKKVAVVEVIPREEL